MIVDGLRRPIVLAPMAGGPSTPALCAAVTRAGGLGFLAGAIRDPAGLRADISAARAAADGPFGVNLFVPRADDPDPSALRDYLRRLDAEAARYGVERGPAGDGNDGWEEKLALLLADPVPVVSFTFGCPDAGLLDRLRAAGSETWVTVNTPEEARRAEAAGADVLVVQGFEAGGHQGGWLHRDDPDDLGLLALLCVVGAASPLPMVAAGGIADGAGVAAALAAGAAAAQVGTAFLRADEAGTDPVYRAALAAGGTTRPTRAFSGRTARGLRNRFMREHGPHAPAAFPAITQATGPIRAAARAAGDPEALSLWAGQSLPLAGHGPAAGIVADLADGARDALRAARRRLESPDP